MSKYFKGIGYVELICFVFAMIIYLVFNLIIPANEAFKTTSGTLAWVGSFSEWIALLVVGPALGLLFVSYGKHIESVPTPVRYVTTKVTHYDESGNVIAPTQAEATMNASADKVSNIEPDISEIHYGSGMITIKKHTINIESSKISDLSMSEGEMSFSIYGYKYVFSYSDSEKAKELYNYLDKYNVDK